MLSFFWNEYFYRPLFNILIYFYNNIAAQNMGVAVIYLTILLRIVLLPFSVMSVWKQGFYAKLTHEISKIATAHKNDQILQNQEIREYLKKHRVNPWSKAVVLGVQALTLILLYQVFMGGIRGNKFNQLYSWVSRPDFVNISFIGFDISARNLLWPAIVAVFLFLEISWEQRSKKVIILNSDIVYKYFFPLFVFITLYFLPMAKSLFILTSLVFSAIVVGGVELLFKMVEKGPAEENDDEEDEEEKEGGED